VSKKKYGALGAHIYAGGHTLGVRATKRFDTGVHLEEGTFGAETSRRELGVEVRVGMDCWNPSAFRGGVDWLYSNPPCAAWSSAGTRRGAAHDLARHTERVFDLMPAVKPTVFSWECVTNVATAGKEFVLERARQAIGWGYDVHLVTLEVADLGLPSMRKRFFFVASKVAMQFPLPFARRVTVREAWKDMPKDRGPGASCSAEEEKLLKLMPVGRHNGSVRNFVDNDLRASAEKHGLKIRPAFSQKRLRWDEPSYTVMGGSHLWHPDEPRRITILEQQVLAGYPKEYKFSGSIQNQYAEIGKAVTMPAAKWLAGAVADSLDADAGGTNPVGSRRSARKRTFQVHDFTGGRFASLYEGVTP
jgi:DNA (cytosine-5)-methyltransferase 1